MQIIFINKNNKNSSHLSWKSKENIKDVSTIEFMKESSSDFLLDQDDKILEDNVHARGVPH